MKDSLKIAIAGATGYVGLELIKILSKHSKLKINTGVNHEKIYQLFNSFFTGMVLRCMELFRFYLRKNGSI